MKVRIKFSKTDSMKYIGHLDLMRFFQKSIRRAEIDIAYSDGFSPHQIMSFASPLGVGITSEGEYIDVQLNQSIPSEDLVQLLNAQMVEGIKILSVKFLPDDAKKSMAEVFAADYSITFSPEASENIQLPFIKEFLSLDKIEIVKKTKKSEIVTDIKSMIYKMELSNSQLNLRLASGSVQNLKPELVILAFFNHIKKDIPKFSVHRLDLLDEKFNSLGKAGTDV